MIAKTADRICIDSERLWDDLHSTARWGEIEGTMGMAREALSDDDKLVRDWFVASAKEIGCQVKIDAIGNIFAILPGINNSIPPISTGSHLDTQPAGGRFDGILGVLAGLEVLRTIRESGIRTYAPIAAICWSNEEGSRFESGCTGSAVWSGMKSITSGHHLRSRDGTTTFGAELQRISYLGSTPASYIENPISVHFELHIEQGLRLEKLNKTAGVVGSIQGIRWFKVDVTGEQGHAGGTPMAGRADVHVAISRLILLLESLATSHGAVATVGVISTPGASSNTIPGAAQFTIDLRHPSASSLDTIEYTVQAAMDEMVATNPKFGFNMYKVWDSPAAIFDEMAVACLRAASLAEVGQNKMLEMKSLAGHDSALTATKVPTAMLFVPSQGGVSHSPDEFTTEEDCGHGAQILLDAILNYDDFLRGKMSLGDVVRREASPSSESISSSSSGSEMA